MASIYKRGNTYHIKFYQNGKRVRRSLKISKRSDALKLKENIERTLAAGSFVLDKKNPPVELFWPEYMNWARAHKRLNTVRMEEVFWRGFLSFGEPQTLGDITPEIVEKYKLHRLDLGKKASSINVDLGRLKAIFNHAIKLALFTGPNPAKVVARLKTEKSHPRFLDKDQIDRVLRIASKRRPEIYWVFALGIYAGLRKGEIVNARWEWFDFESKLLKVSGSDLFRPKNGEDRSLPLHSRLHEILFPYSEGAGYLFKPRRETGDGKSYRYSFNNAFKQVAEEADLVWVTPHTLRHTFASQLAMAGVSLYKISKWLGHNQIATTQIYAHLQPHDGDIDRF